MAPAAAAAGLAVVVVAVAVAVLVDEGAAVVPAAAAARLAGLVAAAVAVPTSPAAPSRASRSLVRCGGVLLAAEGRGFPLGRLRGTRVATGSDRDSEPQRKTDHAQLLRVDRHLCSPPVRVWHRKIPGARRQGRDECAPRIASEIHARNPAVRFVFAPGGLGVGSAVAPAAGARAAHILRSPGGDVRRACTARSIRPARQRRPQPDAATPRGQCEKAVWQRRGFRRAAS